MQSSEEHGLIIVRLFTDEDLFQSLKAVCRKHEVSIAIILSAIGQIKQFTLGYFNGKDYLWQDYTKTHELLSISGMISWGHEENDYKCHLHAVVGDENKQAFGGHLSKGIVEATNEIVILKSHLKVKRRKDEKTGLQSLFLE